MRRKMEGRGVPSESQLLTMKNNCWLYFWELSRNWETRATFHMIRVTVKAGQSHVVVVTDQMWIRHESQGQKLCLDILPKPYSCPHKSGQMWLSMTHTGGLLLPVVPTGLKLNIYTLPRVTPTVSRYCSLHPFPSLSSITFTRPPMPYQGNYYMSSDETWSKHIIPSFNSHLQNYPLF